MRLLILVLIILTGPSSFGQSKQGYIDYYRVKLVFPQYYIGQMEIQKRTNQLTDTLRTLYDNLMDRIRGEYPRNLTSDSSFRRQMEDKLMKLQLEFQEFQEQAKMELGRLQKRINRDLRDTISKELRKFSADNDLICVLNKKAILYCSDCQNFTDDFIAYVKNSNKRDR